MTYKWLCCSMVSRVHTLQKQKLFAINLCKPIKMSVRCLNKWLKAHNSFVNNFNLNKYLLGTDIIPCRENGVTSGNVAEVLKADEEAMAETALKRWPYDVRKLLFQGEAEWAALATLTVLLATAATAMPPRREYCRLRRAMAPPRSDTLAALVRRSRVGWGRQSLGNWKWSDGKSTN